MTAAGETLWPGGRQHWRPTSPVFRDHASNEDSPLAGQKLEDAGLLIARRTLEQYVAAAD